MTGVLVTRPQPGTDETAQALRARGYTPVLAPLLYIQPRADLSPDLSSYDAIAVTSANGVRALAGTTTRRDLPLFAVGDRTGAVAQDLGFQHVRSADGDVAALSTLIAASTSRHVLHVAGADVAGVLRADNVRIDRVTAYDAVAADHLPAEALAGLRDGTIAYVSVFSARTARTFATLYRHHGLSATGLTILCLSEMVAAALAGHGFDPVQVAAAPNAASLLELLPIKEREA